MAIPSRGIVRAHGHVYFLGASGFHARLEGDVRAGSRLLSLLRFLFGSVVFPSTVPLPTLLPAAPPARPATIMRSQTVVPSAVAIAIGCRDYRAVGAPRN
jgi:hypothetical protein